MTKVQIKSEDLTDTATVQVTTQNTEAPTLIVVPFKSAGAPSATQLVAHDENSFDSWYTDVVSNCDALMEVKLVVGGRECAAAYFDTRASQGSTLSPRHVKDALALHKYLAK